MEKILNMAQAQFPEPKDLNLTVDKIAGDGSNHMSHTHYTLDNPHPGYGKDPNIINYLGHTKYPKWATNKIGEKVIVKNAEEEAVLQDQEVELREDGPTIQQWVAHGYKAVDYPPKGFKSKS